MVLNIVTYPDNILRHKNQTIKDVNQEIKNLALDMIDTMRKADGVGLAAPQIGINKKMIVVNWHSKDYVFINPQIIKKSFFTDIDREGCLSFPGFELMIKRSKSITVEATDYSGKSIKFKTEGMFARILQHEIDHLNGKLIIDFADKKKRKEYENKLNIKK